MTPTASFAPSTVTLMPGAATTTMTSVSSVMTVSSVSTRASSGMAASWGRRSSAARAVADMENIMLSAIAAGRSLFSSFFM